MYNQAFTLERFMEKILEKLQQELENRYLN